MENKINQTDLAVELAKARGISKKDAEKFMDTFFSVLEEYIIRDKIVKIKGLGTFKIVAVNDRESVNVNTGERIIIAGHSKLSFTPDNVLKDAVNHPFADFETVPLSENVSVEQMENIEEISPVEQQEHDVEPELKAESESAVVESESTVVEPENTVVEPETPGFAKVESSPAPKKSAVHAWIWSVVTIMLVCLSYVAGYYQIIPLSCMRDVRKPVAEVHSNATETKSARPKVKPAAKSAAKPVQKPVTKHEPTPEELSKNYPQLEDGEYLIIGELDHVHHMQVGETLYKIAGRELGSQKLMPYIMVFNKYPDDIVLHPNDPIRLPKLIKKQ